MARRLDHFTTVRVEGAILPPDLLQRVAKGGDGLKGVTPADYHLAKRERIGEVANRAWNRLLGAWESFAGAMETLPESDAGTSLTRERWLQILFQELGYGRLPTSKAAEVEGRTYAISHSWGQTPIHLVSFRLKLEERAARVAGAARVSPHSLVQEYLNRSDDHLWGMVSNGLRLRLLRDNVSLSRAAYVEFDLQAMMEGEVYADFVLLWLLAHESRVEVPEGKRPEDCWLEKWFQTAAEEGTRVLEHLRDGVEQAIEALGSGFLAHEKNADLRARLQNGELSAREYYHQLLRLVYRLLFLFVAEDRDLLMAPETDKTTCETYAQYYSTKRIRRLAGLRRGTAHRDLYEGLQVVMKRLHESSAELGLPALGGYLFAPDAQPDIEGACLRNYDLLDAIRHLCYMQDRHGRRPVDYRNLGAEELGSVYESLLEQHPAIDEHGTFTLDITAGSDRKTSGSYYTPSSLIQCLLDTALDPVIEDRIKEAGKDSAAAEAALLDLTICDPACGSGHFLVAAARRLAKRLAAVRTGEEEPAAEPTRTALRDVIGRCIYGVDINPMAVELCKINLWIEALEPGKPLSFLDHHIQCGNSLLGTTPALIAGGIPDDAFKPIQGDDKKVCSSLKKENKQERKGQQTLFGGGERTDLGELTETFRGVTDAGDETLDEVRRKAKAFEKAIASDEYRHALLVADAWCGAFVWRKDGEKRGGLRGLTSGGLRRLQDSPEGLSGGARAEIARLRDRYQFFHWHLAFPEVFGEEVKQQEDAPTTGWSGGFGVVLGNPPWERIKLQEKEFFAAHGRMDIANAPNAAVRKKLIEALKTDDPPLWHAFQEAKREAEGMSHLVRHSDRYPLCGRGDVNTYAVFAELMRTVTGPGGRTGCVVPSGIATDDTTKYFFQDLMDKRSLASLYDFENREKIFPAVDSRMKFCLLSLTGLARPNEAGAEFVFFAHNTGDLRDRERRFRLTAEDIALLNPNTRTCPIFRTRRDAEITKGIYRRVPVLIKEGPPEENPWGIKFMRMFDMSNDSHLFRTREQLEGEGFELEGNVFVKGEERWLPLYEAKMIHHFNHRFGDYADRPADSQSTALPRVPVERLQDPNYAPLPRYWVPAGEVDARLEGKWDRDWLLGWRDITNATNERTVIATVFPKVGVGHTCPLLLSDLSAITLLLLTANLSQSVLDYVARQKIGGTHLTYGYLNQIPVLPPDAYEVTYGWSAPQMALEWIAARASNLVCSSDDLSGIGLEAKQEVGPTAWDEDERFRLRCELDAAFFHLYGIPREDVDYIMDTFPIVKRKDEKQYGEYRTKRVILENYDEMAEAMKTRRASGPALPPEETTDDAAAKPLTPWQNFCQEKRLEGREFADISRLWKERGQSGGK